MLGKLRLGRLAAPIHELMKLQAEEDEVNAPGPELMSSYFIMSRMLLFPLRFYACMHAGMWDLFWGVMEVVLFIFVWSVYMFA